MHMYETVLILPEVFPLVFFFFSYHLFIIFLYLHFKIVSNRKAYLCGILFSLLIDMLLLQRVKQICRLCSPTTFKCALIYLNVVMSLSIFNIASCVFPESKYSLMAATMFE